MASEQRQFTVLMRILHWLMAAMVLTMLGIGVAMVASLGDYHRLVSIHRPLGIAILIVVVIRFVNRQFSTLPPFPATMSSQERFVATRLKYCCTRCCLCCRWSVGECCRRRAIPSCCTGRCIFPDTSAQRDVVRVSEQDPHRSRLPFVPGVYRPFRSRFVSHAGRARRNLQPHGAVESSRALGGLCTRSVPEDLRAPCWSGRGVALV